MCSKEHYKVERQDNMTPQENPPEDKPIVTFVMEAEDHDALLAAAAELGCTPAEMVRRITARHVASYKTP